MKLPNWLTIFNQVCKKSENSLDWHLPEPWVHAELYNALKKEEYKTKWLPFDHEIPYITHYPFVKPSRTDRNWKTEGAVKWADLCLKSKNSNEWCWFEFKVRHVGENNRQKQAALQARDAYKKDITSLIGFDPKKTVKIWEKPDQFLIAYWFEKLLKPQAKNLINGKHYFVSAFLQLNGKFDKEIWNEKALLNQIQKWHLTRSKKSKYQKPFPKIKITDYPNALAGGHSLIICEWS